MKQAYTNTPEEDLILVYGAGMGLPNISRNADELDIDTAPGKGTKVKMTFKLS